MGLNINTNMAAITSKNNLKKSSNKINKSIEKLSSGMKINRAADDASGLAISEKMKARIRALDTAIVNCEDGINLVSTIEGYIISVQDMVLRMSELTMKSVKVTENILVLTIKSRKIRILYKKRILQTPSRG